MTAPIVLVGDLVEVVSPGAQGRTGRVWRVDDSTEASTWEICRSTRLMERVTVSPSLVRTALGSASRGEGARAERSGCSPMRLV